MEMHPRVSVPDFDTVWTNIEKPAGDISQRTAWMGQWRGKGLLLAIPVFIGLFLVLVSLVAFFTDSGVLGLIALVLAFLLMIPPAFYMMRKHKEASEEHATEVVAPMMDELAKSMRATPQVGEEATLSASYEPKGGMPRRVLSGAGFIRDPKARQEDFISGTFGQTRFMLSDVKWDTSELESSPEAKARRERRQQRDRERRLREKYGRDWRRHQYSSRSSGSLLDLLPSSVKDAVREKYKEFEESIDHIGPSMIVFAADFHKEFTSKTYLLPRKPQEQAIRNFGADSAARGGMEPLQLEDPEITERFIGWTSDQVEARYLLTPELMLAISDAAERMGSEHIAVSFRGSWMYFAVALDEDRFSFQLDTNDDGGYSVAKSIYEDLVAFLSLVEHFNLNTRIWSKV
ncbi:MAG TPA: DUF3137 domain-containing protein [Candidatus Yaniella excrementigallinarum]|nr:DUF3137 domain-containing protein [Candidatus Yaniella excrementigallinarum]